jgi:hypothetical protein
MKYSNLSINEFLDIVYEKGLPDFELYCYAKERTNNFEQDLVERLIDSVRIFVNQMDIVLYEKELSDETSYPLQWTQTKTTIVEYLDQWMYRIRKELNDKSRSQAELVTQKLYGNMIKKERLKILQSTNIGSKLNHLTYLNSNAKPLYPCDSLCAFSDLLEKECDKMKNAINQKIVKIDISNNVERNDKSDTQLIENSHLRIIDEEHLKEYFLSKFRGMEKDNINYFDIMVNELRRNRSIKEFGQIALMIYTSRCMNNRRPKTFSRWYRDFCGFIGVCPGKYKKGSLKEPDDSLKKLFSYLC